MNKTHALITVVFTLAAGLLRATTAAPDNIIPIRVGNLVYAGDQSSVCFAHRFLETVNEETNLSVDPAFHPVKLGEDRVFDHPFCVFSGEDVFQLTEQERRNLRQYLMGGGFILSSPSCSNADWDRSLRRELKLIFPEYKLKQIPMSDPLFSTVYDITRLVEKHGKTVMLEGLEINGRIVMIYSREGLNDVAHADGCCCCGGNEIREPVKVNVNILTYALLY